MATLNTEEQDSSASLGSSPADLGEYHLHLLPTQADGSHSSRHSETSNTPSPDGSTVQLIDSPATYTAGFSRSPPAPGSLRSRKTNPTPTSPFSTQSIRRNATVQVAEVSLRTAARRCILHAVPILITTVLLTLAAAQVYFGDLNAFSNQDVVLQALQYAAKLHEISLVASLTDIVLHRIRWDLLMTRGVPFGLLGAAYQLSDLFYLVSPEFLASAWRPATHGRSLKRASLNVLIVLGCVLTLTVGPSSGVLMIPKLRWWPLHRPFDRTDLRAFVSNASQSIMWPKVLPAYGCGGWTCPDGGVGQLGPWVTALQFTNAAPQIPFTTGGDGFYRWQTSNATDYGGWTVSSSPMMAMGTILGSLWNWIGGQALNPTWSLKQPKLSLSFADDGPVLQPLIQVQCAAHISNETIHDSFHLPNDMLVGLGQHVGQWDVPINYTEITALDLTNQTVYPWNMYWAKLAPSTHDDLLTMGLIFVMPDDGHTRSVVPCSILAHWVTSDLQIVPKTDRNIHQTISNPLELFNASISQLSRASQIMLSDEWWGSPTDHPTKAAIYNIMPGLTLGLCAPDPEPCLDSFSAGQQSLEYRVSTVLGMFLTDAIARYVPDLEDGTVVQVPNNGTASFAHTLSRFENSNEEVPSGFSTWEAYAKASPDVWREMTISVERFGYGWSFEGVVVRLATVVLLAQAALGVGHIIAILSGRWTSGAWASIADMLTLALRSQRPGIPVDHLTGHEEKSTWAENVTVKRAGKEMELQFALSRAETLRLMNR